MNAGPGFNATFILNYLITTDE